MSSKSIKGYENWRAEQGRPVPKPIDITGVRRGAAPTLPPPPRQTYAEGVRAQASKLREAAGRILQQAAELEEAAERLEGK